MKRAALAMLAPLAGCNWVFGLDPTHAAPDAPDAPPPGVPVHVALLVETLAANGSPAAPMETAFPDLVLLEASTLDGGPPVTLTAGADGTVSVPMEIASVPWRLVYQRQGGRVREYQNLPPEAHVIEPLLGPVMRAPPPTGSGYVITPMNYTGSHPTNRVYTLGAWSEGRKALPDPGPALDYDLPSATSLSGPLATPKAGDRGVLIDYTVDSASTCLSSVGSTDFDAEVTGSTKAMVMGTSWLTDPSQPNIMTSLDLSNYIAPFGEPMRAAHDQFGYLATTDLPLFTRPPDSSGFFLLRNPPMVMLRYCPVPAPSVPPTLQEPIWLQDHFRTAVHTELTATRTIAGATLTNGAAVVTLGVGTPALYMVGSNVAFANAVMFDTTDLFLADAAQFEPGDGPMTLTWSKKSPSSSADFWEVTLIKLDNGAAIRERVYVTTTQSVTIQPGDLSTGTHVFELVGYAGRAPAMNGDFRGVTGDQAISVIHSRTFVVP